MRVFKVKGGTGLSISKSKSVESIYLMYIIYIYVRIYPLLSKKSISEVYRVNIKHYLTIYINVTQKDLLSIIDIQ